MDSKEAVEFVNRRLIQMGYVTLSRQHTYVFRSIWDGKTYQEMCTNDRIYSGNTLKNYGSSLLKRLKEELCINANKASLKQEVERLYISEEKIRSYSQIQQNKKKLSVSAFRTVQEGYRVSDLKKAEQLLDKAENVSSRKQMALALDALSLYRKHGESEIVAALLCKRGSSSWHEADSLGTKAYRLAFAPRMSSIMSWLLNETEAIDMLDIEQVARLRNQCGDSMWLSGADHRVAVSFHQQCESDSSKSSNLYPLFVVSFFNKALCYIDAGDIEEARDNLYKAYDLAHDISDEARRRDYYVSILSLLAYTEAYTGSDNAREIIEQAYAILSSPILCKHYSPWSKHNLPIYLAQALQAYGMHAEAFQMYMQSHRLAIANEDWQVEARGLIGRAQLIYLSDISSKVEKATALLNKAQLISKAIGAEGDYAKASMALGCVLKDLGRLEHSRRHFDAAELLYNQRSATHQVKRIEKLKDRNIYTEIL